MPECRSCGVALIASLMLLCGSGRAEVTPSQPSLEGQPLQPNRILIAAPARGLYLGQTSFGGGETKMLERAAGVKAAIDGRIGIVTGGEDVAAHDVDFNVDEALELTEAGYVFYAMAYEAFPFPGGGFSTDRLIRGEYDADLRRLAAQFRRFGRPMFFQTAREPNGVGRLSYGGFGASGRKSFDWAVRNDQGFAEFIPPGGPLGNPSLFDGLGAPDTCDGLERLAAAQRYYFDFFVRREGINFLTFDTMGWAVMKPLVADSSSHGERLEYDCNKFTKFYAGIRDYSDWISINWYLDSATDTGNFDQFMARLRTLAPGKPVLITELGFCGSQKAEKISSGLRALLDNYPEVKGFTLWTTLAEEEPADEPAEAGDCLVSPDTAAGNALQRVVRDYPGMFSSCVRYSDGTTIAGCTR